MNTENKEKETIKPIRHWSPYRGKYVYDDPAEEIRDGLQDLRETIKHTERLYSFVWLEICVQSFLIVLLAWALIYKL